MVCFGADGRGEATSSWWDVQGSEGQVGREGAPRDWEAGADHGLPVCEGDWEAERRTGGWRCPPRPSGQRPDPPLALHGLWGLPETGLPRREGGHGQHLWGLRDPPVPWPHAPSIMCYVGVAPPGWGRYKLCCPWGPGGQRRADKWVCAHSEGRPGRGSRGTVALRTWQGHDSKWYVAERGGVGWLRVHVGSGRALGPWRVRGGPWRWPLGLGGHLHPPPPAGPPLCFPVSPAPCRPCGRCVTQPVTVPGGPLLLPRASRSAFLPPARPAFRAPGVQCGDGDRNSLPGGHPGSVCG